MSVRKKILKNVTFSKTEEEIYDYCVKTFPNSTEHDVLIQKLIQKAVAVKQMIISPWGVIDCSRSVTYCTNIYLNEIF